MRALKAQLNDLPGSTLGGGQSWVLLCCKIPP